MMLIYILSTVVLLIIVYVFFEYNKLVKLSNIVKEAFATMDVYLKKRWDLVPNIVEVVKGYAKHENNVLEKVLSQRAIAYEGMSREDKIDKNEQLTPCLSKVMAVVEEYPELKASDSFLNLSKELSRLEDEIASSRRYYNAVVKKLNTQIEKFPSNIIAKIFKFKLVKMFEIENSEKVNVKVKL